MYFSSMTPQEIFNYHADQIPETVRQAFDALFLELNENDVALSSMRRENEILREQIYFARELVESIDKFVANASEHCSKKSHKDLMREYDVIRDNSMFET